jgi:ABC-2 type transport system permease protein
VGDRGVLRLLGRTLADGRIRTAAFAYAFAALAYIQPVSYRHTYPTLAERTGFARSFGDNKAIRLFYGVPHDLLTVGGYSAWRVGGILPIFAAVWGVLAAVRAMRAEEDTGRTELVLALGGTRRLLFGTALGAGLLGTAVLGLAAFAGLVAAGLPAGGSAYLALATVCVAPVFVGVGAVASQLAATRRLAVELSLAVVALAFVLRVIADTASGAGRLRWLTPLGWAENLQPFAGSRPLALAPTAALSAALLAVAWRLWRVRDVGAGVLASADRRAPRLALLSGTTAAALRGEVTSLAIWLASTGAFAFIVGIIAKSISAAGVSPSLDRELEKVGAGSILTPRGYVSFVFLFFVLVLALFACAQVAALGAEETGQRLATLLALPVSRRRWLAGRLALAAAGAAAIAVVTGLLAWLGAALAGVDLSAATMLGAGLNCLPVALLFEGVAALGYALAPRAGAGIAYTLVAVAFLWQLFGALLGAPHWLVELSPFAHVGLVPAQPFRAQAAAVMVLVGVAAGLAAAVALGRRDITTA